MNLSLPQPLFSAADRRLTFFAAPKKVSKEKRAPGLWPGPLRGSSGRAAG